VSYETPDEFLMSLEPAVQRKLRREAVESEVEPPKPRVPDADQGHRGSPITVETRPAPDAWLAEVTDLGRYGPDGVGDEDYYRTNYGG
jgi:hypothetical protein